MSFFLFLTSFLLGSHFETLLFTIKSITTSTRLLCSLKSDAKSSDSQSGNISTKLASSSGVVLVPLEERFSWFLLFLRCDMMDVKDIYAGKAKECDSYFVPGQKKVNYSSYCQRSWMSSRGR